MVCPLTKLTHGLVDVSQDKSLKMLLNKNAENKPFRLLKQYYFRFDNFR